MILVDNELLSLMTTNMGQTLLNLSEEKPTLVVFLRHFGCQFCREAMDDISKLRPKLTKQGTDLVFVHMADAATAEDYFKKFNLVGVKHISDPTCRYYAAFGLVKGSFTQLFGLQSFFRGFSVQAKYGNDMGKNLGDSFQMPGAFTIYNGEIKDSYIHRSAADRPNYSQLLDCCTIP
jgi:peroxiredoxin